MQGGADLLQRFPVAALLQPEDAQHVTRHERAGSLSSASRVKAVRPRPALPSLVKLQGLFGQGLRRHPELVSDKCHRIKPQSSGGFTPGGIGPFAALMVIATAS